MKAIISPSKLSGTVSVPPSKSYAHRLLLGAALAGSGSAVHNIERSEDILATLDCIHALGGKAELSGSTVYMLSPMQSGTETPVLPCRESGSTMRFLIPLSLALRGSVEVRGISRLLERGISVYEELFAQKGIAVRKAPERLVIRGRLRPGHYTVRGNISSQFITGLLFALPLLDGDSTLQLLPPVESRPYLAITRDVLSRYGISVSEAGETGFTVPGGQHFPQKEETTEGDWSNGAFLLALNALGGQVQVKGLDDASLQGDRIFEALVKKILSHMPADLTDCPDLGTVLFAIAAAKGGGTLTGIRRLRLKESNRASAMAEELKKLGIQTVLGENQAVILPGTLQKPAEALNAHHDHRIAMALTVLCSLTGGMIEGAECVSKSYPGFFRDMEQLGLRMLWED